jgi:hydroxymethylpyrimidine/phosphomethylpyrimidine kinase
MQWGARQAFESVDGTPAAVFDRGDVGKEPMARLLATDATGLVDRTETLLDAL